MYTMCYVPCIVSCVLYIIYFVSFLHGILYRLYTLCTMYYISTTYTYRKCVLALEARSSQK